MEGRAMQSESSEEKVYRQLGDMTFEVEYSSESNRICVKLYVPSIRVNM